MKIRALLLCAFTLLSPSAMADMLPNAPYVVVRGHAERDAVPDRFALSISVQKTSTDTAEASGRVEQLTGSLVAALKAQGLKPAQIQAGNISINPQYRYDETARRQVFIGNQISRQINARFDDKKSLQGFLAKVPASEEIQIGGISPSLSRQREIENALFEAAAEDAKRQVERLLAQFGQKVIGIYSISQDAPSVGFEAKAMYGMARDTAAAPPPPLGDTFEEGVITVSKDVYVVYLIAAE